MVKTGSKRRPRGPSAKGCFETSKQQAQSIIRSEQENRHRKSEALRALRLANAQGCSDDARSDLTRYALPLPAGTPDLSGESGSSGSSSALQR